MCMDIFYALGEPTRRSIIEMLARKGRLSASEIYSKFPASPPAISQHLKVLREAKLVHVKKQGQQRIYQIDPTGMSQLGKWVHKMTDLWDERFSRLDAILEVEKKKLLKGKIINKKINN